MKIDWEYWLGIVMLMWIFGIAILYYLGFEIHIFNYVIGG